MFIIVFNPSFCTALYNMCKLTCLFVHIQMLFCAYSNVMIIQVMHYLSRSMESRIEQALESHPVIILTGPRQVGKSTLLEHADFLKHWKYLTLDDPDILDQAKEDPKGLLWGDGPVIIDEVQRRPELLLTIKYLVDQTKGRRKFILSGSGNVSLRQAPRETLAGRAKYLHLTGLNFRELHGLPPEDGALSQIWNNSSFPKVGSAPSADIPAAVWRGGLPGVALAANERVALERQSGYIDTYIQRDIQDLVKIRHPENFRGLMENLALATGWESVQAELGNTCGETRSNVSRYMSLLLDTNLLHELRGYSTKGERAYKQSKFYWFDSGVACYLSNIHSENALKNKDVKGRYFENLVLQQILSWTFLQIISPEIYYWKPKTAEAEVDFVVRFGTETIGIEVKSSEKVDFGDTKSMRAFLHAHPDASRGIIVYGGREIFPVATNIAAIPWTAL